MLATAGAVITLAVGASTTGAGVIELATPVGDGGVWEGVSPDVGEVDGEIVTPVSAGACDGVATVQADAIVAVSGMSLGETWTQPARRSASANKQHTKTRLPMQTT
jgi:hypothetical protein